MMSVKNVFSKRPLRYFPLPWPLGTFSTNGMPPWSRYSWNVRRRPPCHALANPEDTHGLRRHAPEVRHAIRAQHMGVAARDIQVAFPHQPKDRIIKGKRGFRESDACRQKAVGDRSAALNLVDDDATPPFRPRNPVAQVPIEKDRGPIRRILIAVERKIEEILLADSLRQKPNPVQFVRQIGSPAPS